MLDWPKIVSQFPAWHGEAEPDSYRNFLGVRTRLRYMPPGIGYEALAGQVEGTPNQDRAGLQDVPEWAGVLAAVLDAGPRFVGVELGAGFGPFVVGAAKAAEQRGIRDIRLVAVEGAASHVEWMHEHFRDNGLDPDQHTIICGVVGTYDGTAQFPKIRNPAVEWGAEARFDGPNGPHRTPQPTLEFVTVPCISLPTLLRNLGPIDFVHFDIQGAERDVIRESIEILDARVRRVVVGTHGRDIEHDLFSIMNRHGWKIEAEKACSFRNDDVHGVVLKQDGVHVWRNPRV